MRLQVKSQIRARTLLDLLGERKCANGVEIARQVTTFVAGEPNIFLCLVNEVTCFRSEESRAHILRFEEKCWVYYPVRDDGS